MSKYGGRFPLGTFVINITGAFLIGLLMTIFTERLHPHPNWRLFLVVGVLGGYTTFSSFEYEIFQAVRDGEHWMGLLYMAGSVALGYAGRLVRRLAGRPQLTRAAHAVHVIRHIVARVVARRRSRSPPRPRTPSRNRACGILRLRRGRRESRAPRCTQTARGVAPQSQPGSAHRSAPSIFIFRKSMRAMPCCGGQIVESHALHRIARRAGLRPPARNWTPIPAAFRSASSRPGPCRRNSAASHSSAG